MSGFVWEPRFDLGVPEMNDEHRVLIAKMNRLEVLLGLNAPRNTARAALHDLLTYTKEHFASEERYMERIAYPAVGTHKRVHVSLIERLEGYASAHSAGAELGQDFFDFLHFWLRAHICGVDAKYAAHAHAPA
ncbi:MAG: hemerythrin family protein [Myxococcales bacterium]|nr:hemerythrin family protein [Myxococcales bacterium]MCB9671469.1 hemerythrin family protein [Alphaproteobacteria bacterium]MCB9693286.1 hemerythrin family protein [Alphaproteobacteria bacterium]